MRFDIKRIARRIGCHAMVLLKGFAKTLYGTAVSGLLGLSVYGFVMIPTEGGYTAVLDFVGAVATLCVAFGGMYAIGAKRRKGGYER